MAKILVADDSTYARSRSRTLLEEMGHEAIEASDGAQAVDAVRRSKPDIILLDLTMPVLDGLSALREILTVDPEARVVIVTATGQDRIVLEAIKVGARDFVMKPFDAEVLREVLTSMLTPGEGDSDG